MRILAFILLLSAGLQAGAQGAVEVTSTALREMVEKKNEKVAASKARAEASLDRRNTLVRSFLPSVELYAGQENFKMGRDARKTQPVHGAEAKVNLLNAWQDKTEGDINELEKEKREAELKRVTIEELEKARLTYWQILYMRDLLATIQSSLDVNKKNLSSALRRIRSGVATDSDRFEFEMNEVELRQLQARTQTEMRSNVLKLALLTGVPAASMKFSEKLSHDHDYENLLKHEHKEHEFIYREQEILAEQLSARARGKGRSWWPTVDAFAAFNQYNEREEEYPDAADRTESVLGIRATMHFSAGLTSQYESGALAKEADAAKALASFQKQETEIHIDTEMAELRLLHDLVHEAEENITRAERYYKLTQSEYGRGVKNSPDVLGASEKLFAMKHKRLEIVRDFQMAKAHVLSKIGR